MSFSLNPIRTKAPSNLVSSSALAQLSNGMTSNLNNAFTGLSNLGKQSDAFGRQTNTSNLNDLIARSQLEGLDAQAIRGLAQEGGIDTSRLTKEGDKSFASLLGGKDAFSTKGNILVHKDGSQTPLTAGAKDPFKVKDKNVLKLGLGQGLPNQQLLAKAQETGDLQVFFDDKFTKSGKKIGEEPRILFKGKRITLAELPDLLNSPKVQKEQAGNQLLQEGATIGEAKSLVESPQVKQQIDKVQKPVTQDPKIQAYQNALEQLLKQENPNPVAIQQLLEVIDPQGANGSFAGQLP